MHSRVGIHRHPPCTGVLALLGGNDHYAVGSPRAVDRRRRGIFEHRDTLHVVRIDEIDVRQDHPVDHEKRVGISCQRTDAPHPKNSPGARRTGGRNDLQTTHLTLQGLTETL